MHEAPHVALPIGRNRFLQRLVALYAVVFVLCAISPTSRSDWLLENLLVFAAIAVLVATHRRFAFSNLSSLGIALFLALHAIGSHYTYSETPIGFWIRDAFGLARNHYDRVVHVAFGALLWYPLHELARRVLHLRGAWSHVVPFLAVLSLSSGYEIVEGWTARVVDPDLGTAFLGTQGDEWDAQKDMSCALFGAATALALTLLYRTRTGHEPWAILPPRSSA